MSCSRGLGMTIADPACGTGGFLLAGHDYIVEPGRYDLDRDDKETLDSAEDDVAASVELLPQLPKRLVVDLIEPETWTGIDADVKGDVYEGLLEKNAADTKSRRSLVPTSGRRPRTSS